jgi:tetratricopeptide (TPR) repeat protein
MKIILPVCLSLILSFSACTKTVYVSVMKPALINVPHRIKTVALINRTLPDNNVANIIEGVLTGETPGEDKEGANQALAGLNSALINSPRYEVKFTEVKIKGSGSGGVLPAPLSWTEIENICKEYNADAVVSLETYDSDFIVTNSSKLVEKNENGQVRKVPEYYAKGVATVKLGFRFYDPGLKTIPDQYNFSHVRNWSTAGPNLAAALAGLVGRNAAVNQVSNAAGSIYATRIAPTWVTESRKFYKKSHGNASIAEGFRRAMVKDYQGAEEAWKTAISTTHGKTAGKAAFNLAVAYEIQGDLEEAKKWIIKSYSDYNVKKARKYSPVIDRRIWERDKLQKQLEE